jgi:hypothetical protein
MFVSPTVYRFKPYTWGARASTTAPTTAVRGSPTLAKSPAEAIPIGIRDPETIGEHQTGQRRRECAALPLLLRPEIEGFQAEHVTLGILRVIIPVRDVSFAETHVQVLKFPGPDGAVGPGGLQLRRIGRITGDGGPAIVVVEALSPQAAGDGV